MVWVGILSIYLCEKYSSLKKLNNETFAHVNCIFFTDNIWKNKYVEKVFIKDKIPEWQMFLCCCLPIQRIHNALEKKKEDCHFDPEDVLQGMRNRKEAFYLHYEQQQAFVVVNSLHNQGTEHYGQWEFLKY